MKNIIYVSTAIKLLNNDQLLDILTSARKTNASRNVTGVLLYSEGGFIQVLEGGDDDVDDIFAKIQQDIRHKNLITLIDEPITSKSFSDWSMGFSTPGADKFKNMLGYLQSVDDLNENPSSSQAVTMLKTFIESNNLTVNY